MFDNIHFVCEIIQPFHADDSNKIKENVIRHNQNAAGILGIDTTLSIAPLNSDFYLSGESRYLFPRPMTENAKKALLYIQSFSVMDMGEQYYTRRKYYASFLLLYTYEGCGILEYEGNAYTLSPGDGFLIDCRKPHHYHTHGERWLHSDLHFWGGNSEYLYLEFTQRYQTAFHAPPGGTYQEILEQVIRAHAGKERCPELAVSNLLEKLLLFLLTLEESPNLVPDNIHYLITYMEQHFASPFSLDELSRFCGISKFHMSRELKKYTGYAPLEFLNRLRPEHAKELLLATALPSYKIGILCGIPNEANFIRLFKKQEGCTPGEFRQHNGRLL